MSALLKSPIEDFYFFAVTKNFNASCSSLNLRKAAIVNSGLRSVFIWLGFYILISSKLLLKGLYIFSTSNSGIFWFDLSASSFYFFIILSSFLSSEPFKIFYSLYVFSSSYSFLDSSFKSWGLLSREASCLSLLN